MTTAQDNKQEPMVILVILSDSPRVPFHIRTLAIEASAVEALAIETLAIEASAIEALKALEFILRAGEWKCTIFEITPYIDSIVVGCPEILLVD